MSRPYYSRKSEATLVHGRFACLSFGGELPGMKACGEPNAVY
jgi:hypothetical protein